MEPKFKFLFRPRNFFSGPFWAENEFQAEIKFHFRVEIEFYFPAGFSFSGPKMNFFFGPKIGLKNDFPQWSPPFLDHFRTKMDLNCGPNWSTNWSRNVPFWDIFGHKLVQKSGFHDDFKMNLDFMMIS